MEQAVKAQCRIVLVQCQQLAFEGLILLFMGARLAVQPFIVPAAGDLQQSA